MNKQKLLDYALAFILAGGVALIGMIRDDRCRKEEIEEEVARQLKEQKGEE